jgi:hypothetical protein
MWQRTVLSKPYDKVEFIWNVMALGDARAEKWRGNWRMEWVASTLQTTSEHGVSSITTADAHTSAANSRLNWHPRRFKWTRPFRRKTKSRFCACAITFQTQSTVGITWNIISPQLTADAAICRKQWNWFFLLRPQTFKYLQSGVYFYYPKNTTFKTLKKYSNIAQNSVLLSLRKAVSWKPPTLIQNLHTFTRLPVVITTQYLIAAGGLGW